MNTNTLSRPLHILAGGPSIGIPQEQVTPKISANDTNGQFAMAYIEIEPGFGPPPHMHRHEDEMFIVIEGDLRVWVDGKEFLAKAGDVVWLPRELPHRFEAAGETKTRVYVLSTGDNFERFFPKWLNALQTYGPDMSRLSPIADEHGIVLL